MASLIDRFLSRDEREWTAEDLQRLARDAQEHRAALRGALEEADTKLTALQRAKESLAELGDRVLELETARDEVRAFQERLDYVDGVSSSMNTEYRRLQDMAGGLAGQMSKLEGREQAVDKQLGRAESMATGIEDSLSGLTSAKTLARQSEEHLHKLNALSEHVAHKAKALGTVKDSLERADTQAHKVNELVWSIDDKVKKLEEHNSLLGRAEARGEELGVLYAELDGLQRAGESRRAEFERQNTELRRDVESSLSRLRQQLEGSELLRQEIEVTNTRILKLGSDVGNHEEALRELERKGDQIATARREAEGVLTLVTRLMADVEALTVRSRHLDAGEKRLTEVSALAARAERQMSEVGERLKTVDEIQTRLESVIKLDFESRDRMDTVNEARDEIETVVGLLAGFRQSAGDVEGLVESFQTRLADLETVQERLDGLDRVSSELEQRTTALTPRIDFVTGVEGRLNRLAELSHRIDERLDSQLAREKELEAMGSEQDALTLQLEDLQKLATTLREDHTVPEMEGRLAELERREVDLGERIARVEALDERLIATETRVTTVGEGLEKLVTKVARERIQIKKLGEEVERNVAQREHWRLELTETEELQRQVRLSSDQAATELRKLTAIEDQIGSRQDDLLEKEERLQRYADRMVNLDTQLEALDRKIDQVNSRHTLVDRIKREVESIAVTCEKSREDALKVVGARKTIEDADRRTETVEARTIAIEDRFERMEKKFAVLEAGEAKVDALGNLIEDIDINLGNFGEQKAVIDHVAEKLAKIDFQIRRAEVVTRELREERELASRIQAGIQSLHSHSQAIVPGPRRMEDEENDSSAESS